MSTGFGVSAANLAGLAARTLGWKADEFWSATPADLANALRDPSRTDTPLTRAEMLHMMKDHRDG